MGFYRELAEEKAAELVELQHEYDALIYDYEELNRDLLAALTRIDELEQQIKN